ncbi:putative zona pellucida sperm-binding protein 1 isoform X1 [Sesbania bispinosa]|nr:putative zona pellucida sperm-binding protein 1 isoform X1 [Sesbania bispinosa]
MTSKTELFGLVGVELNRQSLSLRCPRTQPLELEPGLTRVNSSGIGLPNGTQPLELKPGLTRAKSSGIGLPNGTQPLELESGLTKARARALVSLTGHIPSSSSLA